MQFRRQKPPPCTQLHTESRQVCKNVFCYRVSSFPYFILRHSCTLLGNETRVHRLSSHPYRLTLSVCPIEQQFKVAPPLSKNISRFLAKCLQCLNGRDDVDNRRFQLPETQFITVTAYQNQQVQVSLKLWLDQ